jgi:hypothetical protein
MLNKMALSSFHFNSANALLFFQCALCVVLVQACKMLGLIKVEPFKWSIVRIWCERTLLSSSHPARQPQSSPPSVPFLSQPASRPPWARRPLAPQPHPPTPPCCTYTHTCISTHTRTSTHTYAPAPPPLHPPLRLPVNAIFVGMIVTSFWALKHLNVAMVTVLKNLTNVLVVGGDFLFYGRAYNTSVWVCIGFMILSAVVGGMTDLTFSVLGYFWQAVNCAFTAAYSLYLRGAMDRVVAHTSTGKKLDEFSMVSGVGIGVGGRCTGLPAWMHGWLASRQLVAACAAGPPASGLAACKAPSNPTSCPALRRSSSTTS